jgi:small subunit ribosomal protein S7
MPEGQQTANFKIFDLWDSSSIQINDLGLKNVINLNPRLIIQTHGRNFAKFGQTKVNIIERLMNKLAVAGHRGRKHRIEVGRSTGKYSKNMKIVIMALHEIEKKTGKNPIQVLVRAIENASPRDEITVIEYGGARYPQAVDVAPLRRINLALKHLVHGSSDKAFGKKKKLHQALSEEIILASENNGESFAVKKKIESEKQADSAR